MLEMIEILKVKREFLYLLLTMTHEKNVKVAALAHTNLAEFNNFLKEKENEALLDRMVIIKAFYEPGISLPYAICEFTHVGLVNDKKMRQRRS